jgi:hypothetical protein
LLEPGSQANVSGLVFSPQTCLGTDERPAINFSNISRSYAVASSEMDG